MGYDAEYIEARQILVLSARTAAGFVKQLGGLGAVILPPLPGTAVLSKRPGFQPTVLDSKYWFAKLYECVTYQEISYAITTQYPGFTLHFIKVFYSMYYNALQNFMNRSGTVPDLWATSFKGPPDDGGKPVEPYSMDAIKYGVRTGAIAHIQGDMPMALVNGYKSWAADPKPAFEDLRSEFIDKGESAFGKAQAAFYLDVNDKSWSPVRPEVGQLGAVYYQTICGVEPSLPVMFQWRRDAWQKASGLL